MSTPLRVLILEDCPSDAELMVHELRRAGYEPDWKRVDTEPDYLASLDPGLDIVLAGHALPQRDASRALQLLHERGLDIPVIVVTEALGDEAAVGLIKQGAADYLLKDRLARLGPAVEAALEQKRIRDQQDRAAREVWQTKEKYNALFEGSGDAVYFTSREGEFVDANQSTFDLFGYTREEMIGRKALSIYVHPGDRERFGQEMERHGSVRDYEVKLQKKDGTEMDCLVTATVRLGRDGNVLGYQSIIRDISERKRMEDALRESEELYRRLFDQASVGIGIADPEGNLIAFNDAMLRPGGYTREDIAKLGNVAALYFDPVERAKTLELVEKQGFLRQHEVRFKCKDGTAYDGLMSLNPVTIRGLRCWLAVVEDITERKRAKEALRAGEERLRNTFDAMLEGCQIIGHDWRYFYVNDAVACQGRRAKEDLLGHTMMEMYPGIEKTELFAVLRRCMEDRVPHRMENEFTYPDDTTAWFDLSIQPVPEGLFILSVDITERKRAQESIRKEGDLLAGLLRAMGIGFAVVDSEGRQILVNRELCTMTGYAEEELVGQRPPFKYWAEEGLGEIDEAFERTLQGVEGEYELTFKRKSGERFTASVTPRKTVGADGDTIFVATVRDITERKRAEEMERELATVGEIARIAGSSLDIAQALERFALALEKLVPFDRATLLFIDQEQGTWRVAYTFGAPGTFSVGEPHPLEGSAAEHTIRCGSAVVSEDMRQDRRFWTFEHFAESGFRSFAQATLRVKEEVFGALSLFHQEPRAFGKRETALLNSLASHIAPAIENARLFQQLKQTQEQLSLALSGAHVSTWDWDIQSDRIEWTNAATVYGEGREHLGMGFKDFLSMIHPDDRDALVATVSDSLVRLSDHEAEFRAVWPDGSVHWMLAKGAPVMDDRGRPVRVTGVTLDITERKALQEQLVQAQKMEVVGQLAGGVAHDFNNMLTPILGYAQLAADQLAPDHPVRDYLQQVQKAAERGASLTRQLLLFSRRQRVEPKIVDLNDLVLNMEKLLHRLIGEDIELVFLPGTGPAMVKADPGQMEQVVANMAVNARDAMPDGGKLTIETANVSVDAALARQLPGLGRGRYVKLSVTDTGVGMSEDVRSHLFEPFFTTKEPGKGTGLGLATCYGIVKEAKGHIGVRSEPGRGTTFEVYLPFVEENAKAIEKRGAEGLAGEMETVLLVEDEPSVRRLAAEVLRRRGYVVLEAANGEEALRVTGEHGEEGIDLLVSDIVMPQMGGRELARKLRARCPGIKVLLISGFSGEAVSESELSDANASFLPKPFTPETLARRVREFLGRGSPG